MTVHQLFRANLDHGELRVWTGDGDLTFDEPFGIPSSEPGAEHVYRGGAGFAGVVEGEVRFTLSGQQLRGTPLGGRRVTLFYVGSDDGAPPWRRIPFVTQGLLDSPMLYAGEFSVGIVPPRYDRPPETWSNEEHQRDFPGDLFFSQMKALAKGIRGIWFPDVPHYSGKADYNTRALQGRQADESRGPTLGTPGVRFVAGREQRLAAAVAPLPPGR